jgi:hypothetical protein
MPFRKRDRHLPVYWRRFLKMPPPKHSGGNDVIAFPQAWSKLRARFLAHAQDGP